MPDADPRRLIDAALKLAQALDRDVASVWARASPAIRSRLDATALEAWATQLQARGPIASRRWSAVRRLQSDGSRDPAGEYLRVTFDAMLANGVAGQEMIMLRRDDDGVWRLAGYAMC